MDRERIAPSPPTQTGQAVLPHPAFQFVARDGLAQARDPRLAEESHQPRRHPPRSPVSQAVHCKIGVELQARSFGASGRTTLRHYPNPFGRKFQRRPTPRPCPTSLHGRYPLPSYTSRGHRLSFFKALEVEGEQGTQLRLVADGRTRQTLRDGPAERGKIRVIP